MFVDQSSYEAALQQNERFLECPSFLDEIVHTEHKAGNYP